MTPDVAFRRRMALSREFGATLAELFDTPAERIRWLQAQTQQIAREAERAKRPLERFDIDAESLEAAFLGTGKRT